MNAPRNLKTRLAAAFVLLAGLAAALPLGAGAVAPAPAWKLRIIPMPTDFVPGAAGSTIIGPRYNILATNVGAAAAPGPVVITDTLPAGLTPSTLPKSFADGCSAAGQTVTCITPGPVEPGGSIQESGFGVEVDPMLEEPSVLVNEATIESPGAAPISATAPTTVLTDEAPFGLLEGAGGLTAMLNEADGSPAGLAGAHPNQLTIEFALATRPGMHGESTTTVITSGGGLRDMRNYLPPGLVVNPSATETRCSEAAFETAACPDAAAIGRAGLMLSFSGFPFTTDDALYNLEPPPGSAAAIGFNPFNTGIYVHVLGGLRPGDNAISATTSDIPALFNHLLYTAELQIWGDPTSPAHELNRGRCGSNLSGFPPGTKCPVPRRDVAMLSTPTSCASPLSFEAQFDSWEEPGKFLSREVPFTSPEGSVADEVSGCNALPFAPTLAARPTTNLADSPTGLDVDLHVPQNEEVEGRATAHLKKATVTLPEGLVVNPSGANGLEGCTPAQIGIDAATGTADGAPARCPEASKIGTVEVDSPLLARYDSAGKVEYDGEGHPIAEPIPGAVYIATPHENPFGSLLAIYIAFEEPARGIVVKLAGHVEADPQTGRLTTTFDENPQLPFEDFKLHFFGGASAALKTPLSCGTRTTTSRLTPWSEPEGAVATPTDSFQVAAEPGGGACPAADAAAASQASFDAGTIAPRAGAYSPLVLKLARRDGSAPIAGLDTTLPPGLTGRLAGISYCPEAALAAAAKKSGGAEKQSPSCPPESEVGTVTVGAGAGPTPYYTRGTAYLAGPYKGAPLSLAIVTPATAGPYDLGTVVVRTALYVDPESARIHAVSDPIPQILEGIPLDLRSISLRMERPEFTLNPTSCAPMALSGSALSPFGTATPLSSPFQVGGCKALAFKPKLALSLKGGTRRSANPAFKAVLTMPPGGAAIARASVTLPHSEFLDQGHIRTICTRVQFAAGQCPAASVYGRARAISPLLDQPLEGPVYMRSSTHELPDLVADLNGQIHIVLDGRIDSVKGGIRNTFEAVPDAPVSKFVLEMQGGRKGLLENSTNLCKGTDRATALFDAQNGKTADFHPVLRVKCPRGAGKGRAARH